MSTGPAAETLLRDALLARVGGDRALASAMATLFLAECPGYLQEMHRAADAGDAVALRNAAHALKGSVSNFAASAATEAAARVETFARNGDVASATVALGDVETEMAKLLPALREIIA